MSFREYIWLYRYLWIAPHLLLLAVAAVMFRKRLYKDFPIFFTYLLFEFLQCCLLFTMFSLKAAPALYVKLDLFDRAGDIALHFGILHELFVAPVAQRVPMRRDAGRILNWVMVVLAVLASVFIGAVYYSSLNPWVFQGYVIIEALDTAQCGLVVLVFLWYRFLGLRMSPFAFGIAVGMGLAASLEPLMLALKTVIAPPHGRITDIVSMAAYHVAVLVWLYFALAREKVPADADAALPQLVERAADIGRIARL